MGWQVYAFGGEGEGKCPAIDNTYRSKHDAFSLLIFTFLFIFIIFLYHISSIEDLFRKKITTSNMPFTHVVVTIEKHVLDFLCKTTQVKQKAKSKDAARTCSMRRCAPNTMHAAVLIAYICPPHKSK